MTKERLGLVAAFAVLGVAAVSGWMRKPSPAPASYSANTEPTASPTEIESANGTTLTAPDTTVAYDQYGQPIGSNTAPVGPSYVASSPTEGAQPMSCLAAVGCSQENRMMAGMNSTVDSDRSAAQFRKLHTSTTR